MYETIFRYSKPIKILLILGTIAVVALMPRLLFRSSTLLTLGMLLAVAVPGLLGVDILLRWPDLGLILLIPVCLIVPFSISTGTQTALHGGLLLIILMTGLRLAPVIALRRPLAGFPSRVWPALIVFIILAFISFLFGQLPWFAIQSAPIRAQIGQLMVFVLSALAFWLGASISDLRWLKWMVAVYLALGWVFIGGLLVGAYDGGVLAGLFIYGSYTSLFLCWVTALAFSQAWLNHKLPPPVRLLCLLLVACLLYLYLGEYRDWTSGWLPAVVAIGVILWISRPKLALALTVLAGLAFFVKSSSLVAGLMGGDNEYSLQTRLAAWQILGEIIKVNPLFGVGMANYYWYTPLFPILGWAVQFNSHNNYVDLLAQMGVLGALAFLWLQGELAYLGWTLRSRLTDDFSHAFIVGALGGLAGTLIAGMLGDWILPFVYNVGLVGMRASVPAWVFLGAILAVQHLSSKSVQTTS